VLATSRLTKAGSIQSSSITDEESSKFLAGDTEEESGTYMHALSLRGLKKIVNAPPPTPTDVAIYIEKNFITKGESSKKEGGISMHALSLRGLK